LILILEENMSKYLIVVALLLMIIVNTLAEDKLQIGIKKKVDNCEKKSKKGDRLHMHYTVN
jgi:peptidylprolyl isomerase/FK506-binding protein 2